MLNRLTRLIGYVTLSLIIAVLSACAMFKVNPADTETQQTRKLALRIFTAVEMAGEGTVGVQKYEISLHDAGKVTDDTHRNFQTDLLITARVVRTGLTQIQAATRVPELRNTVQVIIDNLKDLKTKYAVMTDLGPMLDIVISGLSIAMLFLGGA
jgi:hypothetical protein